MIELCLSQEKFIHSKNNIIMKLSNSSSCQSKLHRRNCKTFTHPVCQRKMDATESSLDSEGCVDVINHNFLLYHDVSDDDTYTKCTCDEASSDIFGIVEPPKDNYCDKINTNCYDSEAELIFGKKRPFLRKSCCPSEIPSVEEYCSSTNDNESLRSCKEHPKDYPNPRRISFTNLVLLGSLLFLSFIGSSQGFTDSDLDDEFDDGSSPLRAFARSRRSTEAFSSIKDAESLIPSNYSIHEPPPTNNSESTRVDFSILIMNVRDIKELNEGYGDLELSLEMNLRIYWKDTRLQHLADRSGNKFIVLNPKLIEKIWIPDIFIDHVKAVVQPALITKPASLRVYPDSSVRYSARITVTMACQMDFHYYPADTQRCEVDMKSYAYSSKILALDWREGKGALLVDYLELPNFDVALDTTQNFMVNTSSGSYSGIRFTILLRRKLSYHLIQTYLPSTLFIIVSWLSFLVPPESVPGRMALCMTTLLTLTAMFSAVRQNTPNVSYVKALDIWMVVCIIFVFLTLVEYTVLLKLRSKKSKPKPWPASKPTLQQAVQNSLGTGTTNIQNGAQNNVPMISYRSYGEFPTLQTQGTKGPETVNGTGDIRRRQPNESNPTEPTIPSHPPPPPPPTAASLPPQEKALSKYELAAKKIEKFTSAVIPSLFVIFNFIYWPWLIESANYYDHRKSSTVVHAL